MIKPGKDPIYPVSAEISYLPRQPEINWLRADLPESIGDLLFRNPVAGTLFIGMTYTILMVVCRLGVLSYRMEKRDRMLYGEDRNKIELPREQLNQGGLIVGFIMLSFASRISK